MGAKIIKFEPRNTIDLLSHILRLRDDQRVLQDNCRTLLESNKEQIARLDEIISYLRIFVETKK